jgi:hypothetical protein
MIVTIPPNRLSGTVRERGFMITYARPRPLSIDGRERGASRVDRWVPDMLMKPGHH